MDERRGKQEGETMPTWPRSEAGGCTPQTTHQVGTLQEDGEGRTSVVNTATNKVCSVFKARTT